MSETATEWWEKVSIPGLLRQARGAYGSAMREVLAAIGCDDVPGNGMFVIGVLANQCGTAFLAPIMSGLGVSKQAAAQVVDRLVERGYLTREDDPEDRRKIVLTLTPRGHEAAAAQREARDRVDAALTEAVGAPAVQAMRRALAALCHMTTHPAED